MSNPNINSDFAGRVRAYKDELSNTEQIIADYIIKNEDSIGDYSIHALAHATGVGVASVMRLSTTLGYKGYADMKFQIQQGKLLIGRQDIGVVSTDDANVVKQKVLQFLEHSLEKCILGLDNQQLVNLANAVMRANKVYIYGSGTASTVAQTVTAMFMYLGVDTYSIQDSLLHLRAIGFLNPRDVLLCLNYSGQSKDLGDCMYFAKEQGATTVLITSKKNTLLGKYADYELLIPPRNANNTVNVASSSICQIAILQIVQALIQQKEIPDIMDRSSKIHQYTSSTYYDAKQSTIHRGKVRIADEEKHE